jgi:hypothetical protein
MKERPYGSLKGQEAATAKGRIRVSADCRRESGSEENSKSNIH